MFVYNVCCRFDEDKPQLAKEWLAWLEREHLDDVCQAGAQSAIVTKLDGEPLAYEIRYLFDSRQSFQAYETDHAPRLRAEGLKLFSPERGMAYQRSTGEHVLSFVKHEN